MMNYILYNKISIHSFGISGNPLFVFKGHGHAHQAGHGSRGRGNGIPRGLGRGQRNRNVKVVYGKLIHSFTNYLKN